MKEVIITSQKELDALPDKFNEYTVIKITGGTSYDRIIVRRARENSSVVARENSSVVARGNSSVVARGNSSVVARGNSSVVARGNSSVVARGNSLVVAWENSSVEALENSSVVAWENSSVVARGNSSVVARENSLVEAWENSFVEARENSSVVAWENSSVEAWENSSVEAWENSSVVARENSSVEARGNSSVEARENSSVKIYSKYCDIKRAMQESVIIYIDLPKTCKPKKIVGNPSILYKKTAKYTKADFLEIYEDNIEGESITLYKSVNPNTDCDFYTGKIKYSGVVTCPDWDGNSKRQCGGGLHLSPEPKLALSYNQGKLLKCKVAIKDFVVYPSDITKVRCRKVKVIEEVR